MKKTRCWVDMGIYRAWIDGDGEVLKGMRIDTGHSVYPYRKLYKTIDGNRRCIGFSQCCLSYSYFRKLWYKGEAYFA